MTQKTTSTTRKNKVRNWADEKREFVQNTKIKTKICECGCEIMFVPTGEINAAGRAILIPLDVKSMIYELHWSNHEQRWLCQPISNAFINHFVTCPSRNNFKKETKELKEQTQ